MDVLVAVFFVYLFSYRHFVFGLKNPCQEFHYAKDKSHTLYLDPFVRPLLDDSCKVCSGGEECVAVEGGWCGYYMETAKILEEVDVVQHHVPNKEMKEAVDVVLFDLTSRAAVDAKLTECIPLISQYTNCNKDNVCTGCQICSCTGLGRWNCSQVEQCRPRQASLMVDHRVLLLAMESLLGVGNRVKRSIPVAPDEKQIYHRIAQWMSEIKPKTLNTISMKPNSEPLRNMVEGIFKEMENNLTVWEESFTFDDLMKNVEPINKDENKKYNQIVSKVDQPQFLDLLNMIEGFNDTIKVLASKESQATTLSYSDIMPESLLHRNKQDKIVSSNLYIERDLTNELTEADPHEKLENSVRIMKRDVSKVTKDGIDAESLQDLNDNILIPMINIIAEKQSEIDELQEVKDNIIKFIKSTNQFNLTSNKTKLHDNNTHYAVYKLEISPTLATIITRNGLGSHITVKGYIKLLKHDLLNVLRDITLIKKALKGKDVPKDLKYLTTAIRYYIQEQARHDSIKQQHNNFNLVNNYNIELDNLKSITKNIGENYKVTSYVRDTLLKLLRIIDRGMPESDALEPLSPNTKKVMKRILNRLVSEEIWSGQKEINPNTNIITELKSVESRFAKIMQTLNKKNVHDRLYALKISHLQVVEIINKLSDMLVLLEVYRSRRLKIDVKEAKLVTRNINMKIQHMITDIVRLNKLSEKSTETTSKAPDTHKMFSFIRRLKKIMKNLIHKKHKDKETKLEDLKDLKLATGRKQLKEFEESMVNWQKTINKSAVRRKRSLDQFRKLKNRIQTIIPKYLRTKVSPAMDKLKKKTTKGHTVNKRESYFNFFDAKRFRNKSKSDFSNNLLHYMDSDLLTPPPNILYDAAGEGYNEAAAETLTFFPGKIISQIMEKSLYNLEVPNSSTDDGHMYDSDFRKQLHLTNKIDEGDGVSLTFFPGKEINEVMLKAVYDPNINGDEPIKLRKTDRKVYTKKRIFKRGISLNEEKNKVKVDKRSPESESQQIKVVTEHHSFFPGHEYKQLIIEDNISKALASNYVKPKNITTVKLRADQLESLSSPKVEKLQHTLFKRDTSSQRKSTKCSDCRSDSEDNSDVEADAERPVNSEDDDDDDDESADHSSKTTNNVNEKVEPKDNVNKIYYAKKSYKSEGDNSIKNDDKVAPVIKSIVLEAKKLTDLGFSDTSANAIVGQPANVQEHLMEDIGLNDPKVAKILELPAQQDVTEGAYLNNNKKEETNNFNKKKPKVINVELKNVEQPSRIVAINPRTEKPIVPTEPRITIRRDPGLLEQVWNDVTNFISNIFNRIID